MSRVPARYVGEQSTAVHCPNCSPAVRMHRIRRNPLMRLLGSTTRHYSCPVCEARYFKLRRWMLRLSRGRA